MFALCKAQESLDVEDLRIKGYGGGRSDRGSNLLGVGSPKQRFLGSSCVRGTYFSLMEQEWKGVG